MAMPDFLIIGAMKCGTSTLQVQLAAQPGVFMTTPKEPNFFSDDDVYVQGLDWYESLYAEALPGDLKGEASTHYTKLPTYPESLGRLKAAVPAPKLIYMIRNPVDRLVSHYIHERTTAQISGGIDAACDKYPDLIAYSRYAMQIRPYVEAFGMDSIHLISLEHLQMDPQAELERVGAFLGLKAPPVWQEEQARVHTSADRIQRFPGSDFLILNPAMVKLRQTLVPQGLRAAIKKRLQIRNRPELSPERIRQLEGAFAEDYAELCQMFPDRADLAASYPFVTP